MIESGITYDHETNRYLLGLTGEELTTLRYALMHGVEHLESTAAFLAVYKGADQAERETAVATSERARALADRIEADCRSVKYGG